MSEGGILTGPEICKQVSLGNITIEPFAPKQVVDDPLGVHWSEHKQVQSASYDLCLGNKVAVYRNVTSFRSGTLLYGTREENEKLVLFDPVHGGSAPTVGFDRFLVVNPHGYLDSKRKEPVWEFDMDPKMGWLCKPGIGYLMHTHERILTKRFVPVIDGKSSMGRLFTTAHVTAGYGDAGFNGQYTLEVTVTHPTLIYPGMFFCQMRFHTQVGRPKEYAGHYTDEASMGPVPSMSYKQFEEDHG